MQPQDQFNAALTENMKVANGYIEEAKMYAADAREQRDDDALKFALSGQYLAEKALFLFETARVDDVVTPEADLIRQTGLDRLKEAEYALNEACERLQGEKQASE